MQILSSGSFINFENKEKLEQLVFTAREIANSAAGTEGFLNQEASNKRLALEIWQGAEYMCRDHEAAQIKNIFFNNFLERLREICGAPQILTAPPQGSRQIPDTPHMNAAVATKDEFLGVVSTENTPEQGSEPSESRTSDPGKKPNVSEKLAPDRMFKPTVKSENFNAESNEFPPIQLIDQVAPQSSTESEGDTGTAAMESSTEMVPKPVPVPVVENAISSISLPETEPFQFEHCTVTATIQLLPSENGIRKTIVSVRTHDFAPQISLFEIAGEATSTNLLPQLEKAFEKYRNDLPVKVIDKLKKEKAVGKKPPPNNQNSPNPVARTEATDAGNPAAHQQETELQGSLFG